MNNVRLRTWLFVASEAMLFGGLFSAYFILRAGSITWGWSPHRDLALANTVILFGATGCFSAAAAAARGRRISIFRQLTFATVALAAIFLGVKAYEYQDDFALALYPRMSTRIALYYVLTGVHAVHVIGGMIVSARLARTGRSVWTHSAAAMVHRAEGTLVYWAFLAVIWVILVLLFYVW